MSFVNMADFNAKLKASAKKLTEKQFMLLLRKIGFEMIRSIVIMTPVKTGRARGNWQVSFNRAATGQVNTLDKPGNSTISKGEGVIGNLKRMSLKQVEQIFITNNLDYIVDLENGSSKTQAPAGMVAITVARIGSIF